MEVFHEEISKSGATLERYAATESEADPQYLLSCTLPTRYESASADFVGVGVQVYDPIVHDLESCSVPAGPGTAECVFAYLEVFWVVLTFCDR